MSALHNLSRAASLTLARLHVIPHRCVSCLSPSFLPPARIQPFRITRRAISQSRSFVSSSHSSAPPTLPPTETASDAEAELSAAFSAADVPATVRHRFRGGPPLPPLGTVGQLDAASIDRLLRDLSTQVESLSAEHHRLVRLSSYLHELAQASVGSQMNRAAIMQHEGLITRAENCSAQLHVLQHQLELEPQQRSNSAIAAACAELQPYHLGSGKFAFDFSVDYSFMQMNAAKMG